MCHFKSSTRCGRRKSHVTWLESGDASQPGAGDASRTSLGWNTER